LDDDNKSVEVSGRTIITNHLQEEKLLVYQVLLLFKFLPQFINLILTQVTRPIFDDFKVLTYYFAAF
jgi:hypothetical protein